jgi:hypothetical protein
MVATTMVAGDGRNGRATAEAIQIASELESERERRVGAGLGRFDRPRPEPAGLGQSGRLGGPVGLLSQQASWASLILPII